MATTKVKKRKIVATTKIRKTTYPMDIQTLMARIQKVRFDLTIQRNDVWDPKAEDKGIHDRKSLLIHSLLYGFPLPPTFARKIEALPAEGVDPAVARAEADKAADTDWMLDGKQRLSAIIKYVQDGDVKHDENGNPIPKKNEKGEQIIENGEPVFETYQGYPLTNVPPITVVDQATNEEITVEVNGKRFTELPDFIQDILMSAKVEIVRLENMTDEEQDEMFIRLNNGMPLKNMELTRALAGGGVMKFIEEMTETPFFGESVSLSDKSKNRFSDDELVTQIMMLVYNIGTETNPGFSGDEMKDFVTKIRNEGGFPDHKQALIRATTNYLGEALPYRETFLKKVHIPAIFILATQAMQSEIPAKQFGGYVQQFFAERYRTGSPYGVAASRGSAKKENVARRMAEMLKDYNEYIAKSSAYKVPIKVQNAIAEAEKVRIAAEADQKQKVEAANQQPAETTKGGKAKGKDKDTDAVAAGKSAEAPEADANTDGDKKDTDAAKELVASGVQG